jgi:hypothetical protein
LHFERLKGVRLITSDACIGLAESAAVYFPEAAWQRCVVCWYRNIFSHVPSTKMREIAAMLKAIHSSEDVAAAREKAIRVIEKLRGLRPSPREPRPGAAQPNRKIAVGTLITERPPHRSEHAQLRHSAPTLDV